MKNAFLSFLLVCSVSIFSGSSELVKSYKDQIPLYRDLETVKKIDKQINKKLPLIYNYQLSGGYFSMPSARIPDDGMVALGCSYLKPYYLFSGAFSFFSRVEFVENYRLRGDNNEKMANLKMNFFKGSDVTALGMKANPFIPDVSLGIFDFYSHHKFITLFAVSTWQFVDQNIEVSFGYGRGQINGFYLASAYTPFLNFDNPFFKKLSIVAEYDANKFVNLDIRNKSFLKRLNYGLSYNLFDILNLKASVLRGQNIAASASLNYNLGETKGFFNKTKDPKIYSKEKFKILPKDTTLVKKITCAFDDQKIGIYEISSSQTSDNRKELWLRIYDVRYRMLSDLKNRIEHILANVIPKDVYKINVFIENEGLAVYELNYTTDELQKYRTKEISKKEMCILSPVKDCCTSISPYEKQALYEQAEKSLTFSFLPHFRNYFDSETGKAKYDLGGIVEAKGLFFYKLYYEVSASYIVCGSKASTSDENPSKLFVVRSDFLKYWHANSFHFDKVFLQKFWNLKKGLYLSLGAGYFNISYGGGSFELLYNSHKFPFAIGACVDVLAKRKYSGMSFFKKVEKDGTYKDFLGKQYFLDLYYTIDKFNVDAKLSIGKFMANDIGARLQGSRCYKSGLKIGFWYTVTNAQDKVNGNTYYDKGVFFSIPFDVLLNKSSRTRLGYSIAERLRDCGVRVMPGRSLYDLSSLFCE
jgi:hypothetical protein